MLSGRMVNHLEIKEELLNRIRSADIISTALRGVTTQTDTFNGNGTIKAFTLTKTGVKNVRSVKVGVDTLVAFKDYTFTLSENSGGSFVITFTIAPISGTDNVEIIYDYSSIGDRVYDDFDMHTIRNEDKFPRIAFDVVSERTRDKALQGAIYQSSIMFSFRCFGRGKNETENLANDLRNFLMSVKLDLKRLNYLAVRSRSRIDLWMEGKTQKIFQKEIQMESPYEFEV